MAATAPSAPENSELQRFRRAQRLAYDCASAAVAMMKPGMTEREVAKFMKGWLLDHGVKEWFHQPFAWFGDRTAFRGFGGFHPGFFPTGRRLEPNMPFILDCAPSVDGAVGDIGYSGCLGENAALDLLMDDLAAHRALIVKLVKERRSMAEVSRAVDALCMKQGVEPRHKAYPFSVLAHRVSALDPQKRSFNLMRFGTKALSGLASDARKGRGEGWSPLWSSAKRSDHAPVVGFWAVEPHLGFRGVGAKFEEILVITDHDAYWLDDDLPHVKRWNERQKSATLGAVQGP
ncbi:MAG: M24 family metallopeptidase [Myxococcales bacterium]